MVGVEAFPRLRCTECGLLDDTRGDWGDYDFRRARAFAQMIHLRDVHRVDVDVDGIIQNMDVHRDELPYLNKGQG